MVRRSSRKTNAEIVTIDLARLSKDGLFVLQRYVDQYVVATFLHDSTLIRDLSGQRLPTVSAKTSYKDIWKNTKKFNTARRTMAALASKIQSSSRQSTVSPIHFSELFFVVS
jgi:hypothetical protein